MFDYVSDLHLDNAVTGGPFSWIKTIDPAQYKVSDNKTLIVAGDTTNYISSTTAFLNNAGKIYENVVAVLGNHENGRQSKISKNVHILDFNNFEWQDGKTIYLGGCLEKKSDIDIVSEKIDYYQYMNFFERMIIISHLCPTNRLGKFLNFDVSNKSNNLLDIISPIKIETIMIFGHLHLDVKLKIDGITVLSHPRGYRGYHRDGETWNGKFASY